MSRTYHHNNGRRVRVRGIRRPTDLRRLARVLIELEAAKAEAEAQAADRAARPKPQSSEKRRAA